MERIDLNNKTILVTGAAGFIGSNLVKRLFNDFKGMMIVGIDNMNAYYDVSLKEYRVDELNKIAAKREISQNSDQNLNNFQAEPANKWKFIQGDIADKATIDKLFAEYQFDVVVNRAAQAGVR